MHLRFQLHQQHFRGPLYAPPLAKPRVFLATNFPATETNTLLTNHLLYLLLQQQPPYLKSPRQKIILYSRVIHIPITMLIQKLLTLLTCHISSQTLSNTTSPCKWIIPRRMISATSFLFNITGHVTTRSNRLP